MRTVFAIIAYIAIAGAFCSLYWRQHRASPMFWFPIGLGIIAVGTFPLIDYTHASDVTHVFAHFAALLGFAAGSLAYADRFGLNEPLRQYAAKTELEDSSETKFLVGFLLVFCVIVTIYYYSRVGYNLFVMSILGEVIDDYSSLRLDAYSGDTYLAPGYVNQFKNTLLPLTATVIAIWLRRKDSRFATPFLIVAGGFIVAALLGTGQRIYILYVAFSVAFGFVLLRLGRGRWLTPARALLLTLPPVGLFLFMTVLYQEIGDQPFSAGVQAAWRRIVVVQQEGGLVGFRYISDQKIPLMSEWSAGFRGVLPKNLFPAAEGSSIAHDIHAEMYGSSRGTVPLSAVGSAYLNTGLPGTAIYFALLGVLYTYVYRRFLLGRRSLTRSLAYGTLFFYFSSAFAGPPVTYLDAGALTIVIFLGLRKLRLGNVRTVQSDRPNEQPLIAVNADGGPK